MNIEKAINTIYSRKAIHITLHIFFWLFMLGIQNYLASISFNNYHGWPPGRVFLDLLAGMICTVIFYYPFVYWVLPRCFYKTKIWRGVGETVVLVMIFSSADVMREELIMKKCSECMALLDKGGTGYALFLHKSIGDRIISKSLSLGALIGLTFNIALPLSIKYGLQLLRQQILSLKLAKENLQLEFDFLRSQVNPHFLFNTLNNIYGLIMNDEKKKSLETVAGLTQFLRYSLYESNSEHVDIEKEIQLMRNYINLESIRVNYIKINFKHDSDGSVKTIAPLLMMPVIENAFKHTIDTEGALINIHFSIVGNHINFTVENSIEQHAPAGDKGGIGLINLQKRLELYYPGKFTYNVRRNERQYAVSIIIESYE